jgi:hypothetical protein
MRQRPARLQAERSRGRHRIGGLFDDDRDRDPTAPQVAGRIYLIIDTTSLTHLNRHVVSASRGAEGLRPACGQTDQDLPKNLNPVPFRI